jgi:hypothetical protein
MSNAPGNPTENQNKNGGALATFCCALLSIHTNNQVVAH